jgi:hypothetical protein
MIPNDFEVWEKINNHYLGSLSQQALDEIGIAIFNEKTVIIEGGSEMDLVEYDISSQLNGIQKIFIIPAQITNNDFDVYYAGMRLVKNVNYTISGKTLIFLESLESGEGRRLIIVWRKKG